MGFRSVGGRGANERGAALVEFAFIAMFLLIPLLIGIVEFGWTLGQFNEVRHAAQEGARWGAVSNPDVNGDAAVDQNDLIARACNSINLAGGTSVTVEADNGGGTKGAAATVTVTATLSSLTNFPGITDMLPGSLTNTATFRLEQDAAWANISPAVSCP